MALNQPPHPLGRATRALRNTTEPGWIELSNDIMARVRAVITPAKPILTFPSEPLADGSRTWVSARVVTAAIRRAVADATTALSDVTLVLEHDRLVEVRLEVVCAYHTDLPAAGDRAIRLVHELVRDLRLADPAHGSRVDVLVADVVRGDPRRV